MASDTRIASRYAKSLLSLGIEENKLDELYNDMLGIKAAFENRDFRLFVKSPIIKADKKESVFNQLFGSNVSKLALSFFNILARKGRETFLPEIVESFIHQYKKHNKISEVKLTTAKPLGDQALASIKQALESSKVTYSTVEIETAVDESLIGGFVIEMDDKLYNASVAHKLEEVKKNFLDNKNIKSF